MAPRQVTVRALCLGMEVRISHPLKPCRPGEIVSWTGKFELAKARTWTPRTNCDSWFQSHDMYTPSNLWIHLDCKLIRSDRPLSPAYIRLYRKTKSPALCCVQLPRVYKHLFLPCQPCLPQIPSQRKRSKHHRLQRSVFNIIPSHTIKPNPDPTRTKPHLLPTIFEELLRENQRQS